MEYRVNNLMYATGPDMFATIRTCVTLMEKVDEKVLANAIRKTVLKFPYFAVRLVSDGSEYKMESKNCLLLLYQIHKVLFLEAKKTITICFPLVTTVVGFILIYLILLRTVTVSSLLSK
jgi:hypothetical protein